jgi:hypothetical protein
MKKPDPLETLFSSLVQQASSFVKTLCSCIETTPPCTTSTVVVSGATPLPPATATTTITSVPYETSLCPTPTPTPTPGPCTPSSKCSSANFCALNYECFCLADTKGGVRCVDSSSVDFQCEDAVSCSSSSDYPSGQVCGTNGCCPGNNCTQAEVVYANHAAVLRRAA